MPVLTLINSLLRPIGSTSSDILADLDDPISSTTNGMRSKKVSKLLPYPVMHYYLFEGKDVMSSHSLPRHVTELARIRSFKNVGKADIVLFSAEAEDLL